MHAPIVGPSVELRPFTMRDVTAAHAIYSDPEVMRWVGRGAVPSIAATEAMLRQYIAHQDAHGFGFWAVTDRETGALIGDGGIALTVTGEIEMGYTLARDEWGKGRATEIAGLWVATAFDELGFDRVRALVEAPNLASRRVLEKLGFHPDGVTMAFDREHLVFRLARGERSALVPGSTNR